MRRRAELRWTQPDLANVAGVSITTISNLETGTARNYQPAKLYAIEHALFWPPSTVEELLAGRDPDIPPAPRLAAPRRAAPEPPSPRPDLSWHEDVTVGGEVDTSGLTEEQVNLLQAVADQFRSSTAQAAPPTKPGLRAVARKRPK